MTDIDRLQEIARVLWDELHDAPATRTYLLRAVARKLGERPRNGTDIDILLDGLSKDQQPMASFEERTQLYRLRHGVQRP